jgi:hypothetical protein
MFYGKPTRLQVRISPVFTPRRTDAVGQAPFEEGEICATFKFRNSK